MIRLLNVKMFWTLYYAITLYSQNFWLSKEKFSLLSLKLILVKPHFCIYMFIYII